MSPMTSSEIQLSWLSLLLLVSQWSLVACRQVMSDNEGLYDSNDDVIALDVSNLTSVLSESNEAWLVEFYSAWCGHCIHFAPTYKRVAATMRDWRGVMRVAAINCAADRNIGTCRDYEVMGYPTLRFFGPHASKDDMGEGYEKSKEEMAIVNAAVNFIKRLEMDNNDIIQRWPYLWPVSETKSSLTSEQSLVIVSKDSLHVDLDARLLLDVHGRLEDKTDLALNIVNFEDVDESFGMLVDLEDSHWPKVLLVEKRASGLKKINQRSLTSQQSHQEQLDAILALVGVVEEHDQKKEHTQLKKKEMNEESMETRTEEIRRRRYTVFMADLEKAVVYALGHEVAQHAVITGDALIALQKFSNALQQYFPARPAFRRFLDSLNSFVQSNSFEVKGEAVSGEVSHLLHLHSILINDAWIGCRGSQSQYGGYPCGLWTLFHTLTLGHLEVDQQGRQHVEQHVQGQAPQQARSKPYDVLEAVTLFVKEYFGCRECASHFLSMATKHSSMGFVANFMESIEEVKDEVVWLWRAHNRVNDRLSGALTDDPVFPKHSFPSRQMCDKCYVNVNNMDEDKEDFHVDHVVSFLQHHMYGKNVISNSHLQLSPQDEKQAANHDLVVLDKRVDDWDNEKLRSESMKTNVVEKTKPVLSSSPPSLLSASDWRLCLLIYFVSMLIMVGVFVRFGGRRRLLNSLNSLLGLSNRKKAFNAMV